LAQVVERIVAGKILSEEQGGQAGEENHGLRSNRGLIEERFATKVGETFFTISRWENCRGTPSPLAMRRIEELMERTEDSE